MDLVEICNFCQAIEKPVEEFVTEFVAMMEALPTTSEP